MLFKYFKSSYVNSIEDNLKNEIIKKLIKKGVKISGISIDLTPHNLYLRVRFSRSIN